MPAPAKTFRRIQGVHRISTGARRVLVIRIEDSFGNRIVSGITWRSSNSRVVRVVPRPNGTAVMTGLRRGTVTIRAHSGSGKSRAFRVTVR